MGVASYEGTGRRETLYRLALCLELEFDVLMNLPVWEVRERSLFSGEQKVQSRLETIKDLHYARIMSRAENPAEQFNQLQRELLDDVLIERLLPPDEHKKRAAEHNYNVLKTWIKEDGL